MTVAATGTVTQVEVQDPQETDRAAGGVWWWLTVRHRHNWIQLIRFSFVGGSGVVVNLVVFAIVGALMGEPRRMLLEIPVVEFQLMHVHLWATIAFVVANLSNFQLNRSWTFGTASHAKWLREYAPFLAVGLIGLGLGLVILTALLADWSPVNHSPVLAQLITVVIVTPIGFVGNKLWTFRAARGVWESNGLLGVRSALAGKGDERGGQ